MTKDRRDPAQPDRRSSPLAGGRRTSGGRRATDKLACPHCGCLQSSVLRFHPSVEQQQTGGYWRRRSCGGCGREFETEEVVRLPLDATSRTHDSKPLPS